MPKATCSEIVRADECVADAVAERQVHLRVEGSPARIVNGVDLAEEPARKHYALARGPLEIDAYEKASSTTSLADGLEPGSEELHSALTYPGGHEQHPRDLVVAQRGGDERLASEIRLAVRLTQHPKVHARLIRSGGAETSAPRGCAEVGGTRILCILLSPGASLCKQPANRGHPMEQVGSPTASARPFGSSWHEVAAAHVERSDRCLDAAGTGSKVWTVL